MIRACRKDYAVYDDDRRRVEIHCWSCGYRKRLPLYGVDNDGGAEMWESGHRVSERSIDSLIGAIYTPEIYYEKKMTWMN